MTFLRFTAVPARAVITGAAALLLVALSGCEGIGQGLALRSLEIRPANGSTQTAPYKMFECLRDEFLAVGTFTDGSTATFNTRAVWTSSDPTRVRISNGDIPTTLIIGGQFQELSNLSYVAGTAVPVAPTAPGEVVTITAEFVGLRASLDVVVRTPRFSVVPAPHPDPTAFAGPAFMGVGTFQRFAVIGNLDGRILTGAELAATRINGFAINPFLWRFPAGEFQARDTADLTDFDKWVVPSVSSPTANIAALSGTVTGIAADPAAYAVEAQQSLCATRPEPELNPTAGVRVAPFADVPLALAHEAGFSGSLAAGTNELLAVKGQLDTDGDGSTVEAVQELSNQVRFALEPKDATCDSSGLNCLSNKDFTFSGLSNALFASTASTGGSATVQACFPLCVPTVASLSSDAASSPTITFTAAAVVATPDITVLSYTFDFGDGSAPLTQDCGVVPSCETASYTYAPGDAQYTATVRIADSTGAVTQNAGAVQVVIGAAPANTAPTAALSASPRSGAAPLSVTFNASSSAANDSGDSIKVYEFDFGDGVVVRQSSTTASHVYLSTPASTPSVVVYDARGGQSTNPAQVAVTVDGSATLMIRSNALPLTALDWTLCSVEITPATATEEAFTFPGFQFDALGTFIQDTDTDDCAVGPVVGTQEVTRSVSWAARPAADSTEFSDIGFMLNSTLDFTNLGQIRYSTNVGASTDLFITATPLSPFSSVAAPAAATLTVTPCPDTTCPP